MPRRPPTDLDLTESAPYRRLLTAGGAARYAELVRQAADRASLRHLVRRGLVVTPGRATYALPGASADLVRAARFDAHVDCISALRLQDVTVLNPPTRTHLVVPRNRSGSSRSRDELRRVRLHRTDGELAAATVAGRLQSVERSLARVLVCCPRDDAVVALDSALNKGLATLEGIRRHLPVRPPERALDALAHADEGAASIIETLARLALVDAGFTVRTQRNFARVGDVDLLVEGLVVVELDGYEFHSSRVAFRNDRRRDRELHGGGLVVLRFTYEDVMNDPTCVVRAVQAALRARRPGTPVLRPLG